MAKPSAEKIQMSSDEEQNAKDGKAIADMGVGLSSLYALMGGGMMTSLKGVINEFSTTKQKLSVIILLQKSNRR